MSTPQPETTDHPASRRTPAARPGWRVVGLPSEHGGWGLTAEPILLGLLLAPSAAGLCLGVAAMAAFLARTPIRVALVDRHRGRRLDRTRLAQRIALVEIGVIAVAVAAAVAAASNPFWWPALVAAPLVGVELWYDARSRSRRLAPELAGAVGVAAVAAMIVLAGGHGAAEATAAWLVLAARSATSIPHVREQIARLHHRRTTPRVLVGADLGAAVLAASAVALDATFLAGAIAVSAVIVVQRATASNEVPAKILGVRQMVLGLLVVAATALGVRLG